MTLVTQAGKNELVSQVVVTLVTLVTLRLVTLVTPRYNILYL